MIAAHHSIAANAAGGNVFSMRHDGTGSQGFVASNIGTATLPQTITLWYRWDLTGLEGQPLTESRCIVKHGDNTSGIGYGLINAPSAWDGGGLWWRTGLIELKYWAGFERTYSDTFEDESWHHLALIVRSGLSPLHGTCYVDGVVYASPIAAANNNAAMNVPKNEFWLCGRGNNGDGCAASDLVSRVCIFNGALSSVEIEADMALGRKAPVGANLIHYWDGTAVDGVVQDLIGNWHLTSSNECSLIKDTPWNSRYGRGGGNLNAKNAIQSRSGGIMRIPGRRLHDSCTS